MLGQLGWPKDAIDHADLYDLMDIVNSGAGEPQKLADIDVDALDYEGMRKNIEKGRRWLKTNGNS